MTVSSGMLTRQVFPRASAARLKDSKRRWMTQESCCSVRQVTLKVTNKLSFSLIIALATFTEGLTLILV